FTIGLFLGDYMVFIMTGAVIFGIAGFYYFRKVESGRRLFWRFINRVPVVSDVLKRIALQRFATTLASLMRAGLPILASLEITADAVGLADLKDALIRISREGVAKGLTLGDAFRREPAFPRVVTNLVAISEKAGHIEDVLGTLADFYESEIDVSVKTLVSFLEPIMLLLIGGVIGAIALSIIIPIYQLVGQF
ncbi:MAG: type II secretion system F family protein, partial [Patescibacteria group bacterium]